MDKELDNINDKLLQAFKEQNLEVIVDELTPLFYKYMKGVPSSMREDVFQELRLNCIEVVSKYDFSKKYKI